MKKIAFLTLLFCPLLAFSQATGLIMPDFTADGPLGTADATVDNYSIFNLNQSTPGITISIPNPTNVNQGREVHVTNVGSVFIKVLPGGYIKPGVAVKFRWLGSWWSVVGDYVIDQNANTALAGPSSGTAMMPSFRALVDADMPANVIKSTGSYSNPSWITSLAYSKLTGMPSIPTAPVNADWFASSGLAQILNKPTIPSTTTQIAEGTNLYYTDVRARASNSAGTGISYNSTTGVITNSSPDQTVTITAGAGVSITGTYPNFVVAAAKRQENYSGTSNASGLYTVTFPTPYGTAPNIQPSLPNQANTNVFVKINSVTTTGFTINVFQRNSVNLLGIDVLLFATSNVSGASVDVLVTEK